MDKPLTHLDEAGRARMVDVGGKAETAREALAQGAVRMAATTLARALAGDSKKGDVRAVAEIAGVMAAKRTAELIPLCHPLPLNLIEVNIEADAALPGFTVSARARTHGKTGVEMEALTAVSVACLAIYDMLKAIDRDMVIERVRVLEKSGGASGEYKRQGE
jgi:cyclic pyranopterin monophosphate synthase